MVELKVLTLIVTGVGSPSFLVLQPIEDLASEGKSRVVPICVGAPEAMSLGAVLENAIALALRQGAPIYIDEGVLERASFPYLFRQPYDEEQIVDDFKDFLKDISPDDFA